MAKSGYLQRQQETINSYRQAEKETYTQFMVDLFMLVLNNPEVMGKDVFGRDRIARVIEGVSKTYDEYVLALTKDNEADYYQEKLDRRIKAIVGDERFVPFSKRYSWIFQKGYGPRR